MNRLRRLIQDYETYNEQERVDKDLMLTYIDSNPDCLNRTNRIAHFTASSWIVDSKASQTLMVFHNIYNSWSWTGGHADGESDLLAVSIREAKEETGVRHIRALKDNIFSLEVITVDGHMKRGEYVPSHLHLNITFLLEVDSSDPLAIKADENSGVKWFDLEDAIKASDEPWMRERIYSKLNNKLEQWKVQLEQ